MKDPNVITYEQMIEQPIEPIESYEESGGCNAGGAAIGLLILLTCIVAIIITVNKN